MAKKKQSPIAPARDLAHAAELVAEGARITAAHQQMEARMNNHITKVKETFAERARPGFERLSEIEAALELFSTTEKGTLFVDKKTIEVAGGEYGFRSAQIVVKPKGKGHNWDTATAALQDAAMRPNGKGFRKYLIDQAPIANKEALRELSDEALDEFGLKRIGGDDSFFLKLNPETLEKAGC